jgi:hypothetical protein
MNIMESLKPFTVEDVYAYYAAKYPETKDEFISLVAEAAIWNSETWDEGKVSSGVGVEAILQHRLDKVLDS